AGLRANSADRGGRRGGDRACHPGRLFPQPRIDRRGRYQSDEGLSMYQWIVFFPLLGAIVAGCISLVTAHARHPGGTPEPGGGHHGLPPHADAAVHPPHAEPTEPEPAAVGSREAELVTTVFLFASMVMSWIAFVYVGFGHHDARVPLFPWIVAGNLH